MERGPPGRAEVTAVITNASIVLTELRVLLSALSHQQPWELGPLITPPCPTPHPLLRERELRLREAGLWRTEARTICQEAVARKLQPVCGTGQERRLPGGVGAQEVRRALVEGDLQDVRALQVCLLPGAPQGISLWLQVWEQPELNKFWQVLPLTCYVTSRKRLSLPRPQCPSLSNVQLEFPPHRRLLGSKGITVRKGLY